MKVIIVGVGKVGYAIAGQLSVEKHDVVIVDSSAAVLEYADSTLDIMCVEGNGASVSVLKDAGAAEADLVIAVTNGDEANLVCCLIAKKLGAKHTVARVRNTDYRRDAEMLKREIGLDMVINPDLAAAREIARILSFPAAFSVEPFVRGRIDMIGFHVSAKDTLAGVPLSEFNRKRTAEVLFCAAEHNGEYVIPDGNFVPQPGDRMYVVGAKHEVLKMLKGIGRSLQRVKEVSLLGGSRIAMYLPWELQRPINARVRIVEKEHADCMILAEELPGAMVIKGDGTDSNLIQSEGIFQVDAFVSLTGRDEENLLMALSAQHAGVPKGVAKMNRPGYMDLVHDTGIESIISPKDIVANQITSYVRALANSEGSAVESLYRLLDGTVEVLEFTVGANCEELLNIPLKELKTRKGLLLAAIVRDYQTIIPDGNTCIEEGDHVVVVTRITGLNDLTDILA